MHVEGGGERRTNLVHVPEKSAKNPSKSCFSHPSAQTRPTFMLFPRHAIINVSQENTLSYVHSGALCHKDRGDAHAVL